MEKEIVIGGLETPREGLAGFIEFTYLWAAGYIRGDDGKSYFFRGSNCVGADGESAEEVFGKLNEKERVTFSAIGCVALSIAPVALAVPSVSEVETRVEDRVEELLAA